MRIISPIDSLQEASQLIEAGADELYGGYLPESWQGYSLAASINQRTFPAAQIATEKELSEIITLAHDHGRTFALTLNAPYYTEAQLPLLCDYVDRMVGLGIDSLILADVGLLRLLRQRHPDLEYHASTLAHLGNAAAVRFFVELGITRAVLPRHLTVADIAAIVREVHGVRCDAFLLVGKCPNTEGLCTFHHSSPQRIWPCEIPYDIQPCEPKPSAVLQDAMRRQNSWSKTDRRHGCGLCAIPHLQRSGVHGLKLVGRGAPPAQKVRNILLTREFLSLSASEPDFSTYRQRAMMAHRQRFGAVCHQNVCYYPEFFEGGAI